MRWRNGPLQGGGLYFGHDRVPDQSSTSSLGLLHNMSGASLGLLHHVSDASFQSLDADQLREAVNKKMSKDRDNVSI